MAETSKLREALPRILVEMASIVFAVLLALAVNEWRENRASEQKAEAAMHNISQEMSRNRYLIDRVLPNRRQALARLQAEASERSDNAEPVLIDPVFLRRSAWDAAIATDAMRSLPFERVGALAEIYTFQAAYEDFIRSLLDAALQVDYYQDAMQAAQLDASIVAMRIMTIMEGQLDLMYSTFLDGDGTLDELLQALRSQDPTTPTTSDDRSIDP